MHSTPTKTTAFSVEEPMKTTTVRAGLCTITLTAPASLDVTDVSFSLAPAGTDPSALKPADVVEAAQIATATPQARTSRTPTSFFTPKSPTQFDLHSSHRGQSVAPQTPTPASRALTADFVQTPRTPPNRGFQYSFSPTGATPSPTTEGYLLAALQGVDSPSQHSAGSGTRSGYTSSQLHPRSVYTTSSATAPLSSSPPVGFHPAAIRSSLQRTYPYVANHRRVQPHNVLDEELYRVPHHIKAAYPMNPIVKGRTVKIYIVYIGRDIGIFQDTWVNVEPLVRGLEDIGSWGKADSLLQARTAFEQQEARGKTYLVDA